MSSLAETLKEKELLKSQPRQTAQRPLAKARQNSQSQPSFEQLLTLVDVVSFDLFDTLLHRPGLFSPKDLFYQVVVEVERQLGLCLNDFAAVRVRAEEIARVRAWGHGIQEVTLDEIYAELRRLLNLETGMAQTLKEIELKCERSALTALESGQRLFEAALVAAKKVVIVSDTYFDEAFITEILAQHGYSQADKVYISSTYGKTKVEGDLYPLVLKDLACPPNRLLHVGDNQLADVTMALGQGIRPFFVPTPKHRLKWRCGLGDVPSGDLVLSRLLDEISHKPAPVGKQPNRQVVLTQAAEENLSLLYYSFSVWLLEQLKKADYQRVYFAARDGLIMKRFFDLAAATAGFAIDSRYLYVSRAALYPSLIFTDPSMARRLFSHNWDHLTIEDALGRISVPFERCADLLRKHGLAKRNFQLNHSTVGRLSAFLEEAWPLLEQQHEEYYQCLLDYLTQEKMLTTEKTAFVDIGWHGSLQHALLQLLKHVGLTKELTGFYLGTFAKPLGATADFKANGFLVNNDEPQWISNLVRFGPSVIELFHSAGHGGVLGYQRDGGRISPILADNPEEQAQFLQLIEPVQNMAFAYVRDHLARQAGVTLKAPDPGLVARTALRLIYAPTAAEATTFGPLKMASDFGGRMRSVTGLLEWNLAEIEGNVLPDGKVPMWRPGFQVLQNLRD